MAADAEPVPDAPPDQRVDYRALSRDGDTVSRWHLEPRASKEAADGPRRRRRSPMPKRFGTGPLSRQLWVTSSGPGGNYRFSALRSGSGRPSSHKHPLGGQLGLTIRSVAPASQAPRPGCPAPTPVAPAFHRSLAGPRTRVLRRDQRWIGRSSARRREPFAGVPWRETDVGGLQARAGRPATGR
jgi:hypothetical protein